MRSDFYFVSPRNVFSSAIPRDTEFAISIPSVLYSPHENWFIFKSYMFNILLPYIIYLISRYILILAETSSGRLRNEK